MLTGNIGSGGETFQMKKGTKRFFSYFYLRYSERTHKNKVSNKLL